MKKLLSFLTWALFLVFIVSALYVFDLWPFQQKDQLMPSADENKTQTENPEDLPDELKETKITRSKTYEEYMRRGELLEKNNYLNLAIAEYEEAQKLHPTNIGPLLKIGQIHLKMQQFGKAEETFQRALQIAPQSLDLKLLTVQSMLGQRKISEAKKMLDGVEAENQNLKYYQGILSAFFGDHEQSRKLLQKARDIGSDQNVKNKAQNYLNAYEEFYSNQEGTPVHLKTLLARSYNQTGEHQMAIALLFDVIKEKQDYRDAWIILGHSYLNVEKYQEAVEALNEARKIDITNSKIYFFLGLAYHGLNDFQNAATVLEKAKQLGYQPVIQINQKLAEIYLEMKEYQKSAANYEQAIALNDADVNYYIRPVWLYIDKLNQPQKAFALAQKTLVKHNKEAMSYNLIGWAYLANNKFDKAQENFQKALNINPNLDAIYLNYGRLEEKRQNYDQALAYYQKAVNLGQGNSIAASATELYNKLVADLNKKDTMKADVLNP